MLSCWWRNFPFVLARPAGINDGDIVDVNDGGVDVVDNVGVDDGVVGVGVDDDVYDGVYDGGVDDDVHDGGEVSSLAGSHCQWWRWMLVMGPVP